MDTMNELNYTCCFCGKKIESNQVDPMNINVVGNYDKLVKDSPSQDFYCHFDCFKMLLQKDIAGYFLKSNFGSDDE
jgi:hypothetical protein